jgi:azurin
MESRIKGLATAGTLGVGLLLLAAAHSLGGAPATDTGPGRVVEVKSIGIELEFDIKEIRATAGETLTIRYVNSSDMAHNIILLTSEDDVNPVGTASWQAHANEWVPEDEKDRIIASTEVAGPGEVVEVTFVVPPPGTYPYICTYSGHWTAMQGRLISTEDG